MDFLIKISQPYIEVETKTTLCDNFYNTAKNKGQIMDTVKYVPDAKNTTEFNRLDRECSNIGHLEDVCTDAERSVMRNFFNHAPDSGLYSFLVHKNSYVCSVSSYLAKDGSRALKFCFRTYYSVVFASGLREQGNRDDKYDTEIVLYQDGGIYIKRK